MLFSEIRKKYVQTINNYSRISKKTVLKPQNRFFRDSRGIQTHNLLIRSQMLYSVELGSRPMKNYLSLALLAGAKVLTFFELTKLFFDFFQKTRKISHETFPNDKNSLYFCSRYATDKTLYIIYNNVYADRRLYAAA